MDNPTIATIAVVVVGAIIILLGIGRMRESAERRQKEQLAEEESFELVLSETYKMLEQQLNGIKEGSVPVRIVLDRSIAAAPYFTVGDWPKEYASLAWLPGEGAWWATYQGNDHFLDIATTPSAAHAASLLIATYKRKQVTAAATAASNALSERAAQSASSATRSAISASSTYRGSTNHPTANAVNLNNIGTQQVDTNLLAATMVSTAIMGDGEITKEEVVDAIKHAEPEAKRQLLDEIFTDENAENDRIVEEILEAKREREEQAPAPVESALYQPLRDEAPSYSSPEPAYESPRYESPTYESPSYDSGSSSSSSSYDSGSSSSGSYD